MIQRIQSVWLLLAALFGVGLFMFGILTIKYTGTNGAEVTQSLSVLELNNVTGYLLAAIAIAIVALPAIAIFMFKNRKLQTSLSVLAIVLNIGFIAFYIMGMESFKNAHVPPVTGSSFGLASFMPIVSIIFLFMAIRGIRKDQKLVKSLDRLR